MHGTPKHGRVAAARTHDALQASSNDDDERLIRFHVLQLMNPMGLAKCNAPHRVIRGQWRARRHPCVEDWS